MCPSLERDRARHATLSPEATGYSQKQQRRSYPKTRTDFLPPLYVPLTRERDARKYLERRRADDVGTYVFPGQGEDNAFGSLPNHWKRIFEDSPLSDVTPHLLRHSFASIANDLGLTEVTIAALAGHAKGSLTSKYIHTLDTALIMAADTISCYIKARLDCIEFKQTAYALDRDSRKAALARSLEEGFGRRSSGG